MKARNILFLILASLLLCTAVSAAEYTDVSDAHWAYKQINYLDAEITGYPDGTRKSGSRRRATTGGRLPIRSASRMIFWTGSTADG